MQSLETLQHLFVPTVATPEGRMRVADNDGKPVPYEPRPRVAVRAEPRPGLVSRLQRKLASLRQRLLPAAVAHAPRVVASAELGRSVRVALGKLG
ncbi:MAG TPA: hypothetical protein VFX59_04930 [Polyangiales bacterium]|nr:hypothetical protein [Polyangiales bacterium]